MFKVTQSPTFWATVKAEVQTEDGRRMPVSFDVQFKRLTETQVQDLTEKIVAEHSSAGPRKVDIAFLHEVVVNWRHVQGDGDSTLDFSPAALAQVCDLGMAGPMLIAFHEARPRAKAKN